MTNILLTIMRFNTVLVLVALMSCSTGIQSLKPDTSALGDTITIQNGALKATFVTNQALGSEHKAGYNGIAMLYHTQQDSSPFVPFYAGFNLEHIFGGDSLHQLFEPRRHPMSLHRESPMEVSLYQTPTPLSKVESLTTFKLTDTHCIDVVFECIFHDDVFFEHDYAGLFWASYIQKPRDKKIYFLGTEKGDADIQWIAAYSEKHGEQSTHLGRSDPGEIHFASNFNASLASHFSNYKYEYPFYYGRYHNMMLAYFFDSDDIIRFSQSPTGGGRDNPAWDFQYIIPGMKTGKKYSFKARILYKPFENSEDVLNEFLRWKKGL